METYKSNCQKVYNTNSSHIVKNNPEVTGYGLAAKTPDGKWYIFADDCQFIVTEAQLSEYNMSFFSSPIALFETGKSVVSMLIEQHKLGHFAVI